MTFLSLFISLLFLPNAGVSISNTTFPIGLVLDLDSVTGRIGLSCLNMALSDFYLVNRNFSTMLVLHVEDSKGQVIDVASSALRLLKDVGVDAIIGPQTSGQASFLVHLGERAKVPIISFSATSPSLNPQTPYFVQTAVSDDAQVKAIASIIENFKWSQVVLIYEDSDYGNGIVPFLSNALQDVNARVSYRSVIPLSASDDFLLQEIYKMKTMQTRVFVVHISNSLASRLFVKAKEAGMVAKGYAWIITSGLMDLVSSMDPSIMNSIQGFLGVKPLIPRSENLSLFAQRWRRKFLKDNPDILQAELSLYGLWAYDALWALAIAADRVRFRNSSLNVTSPNSTDMFDIQVSQTGPELLKKIMDTRFVGLVGSFHLVNRRREVPSFEILNVVGRGERQVGIWTPSLGISRGSSNNITRSSDKNLKIIIWPGESTVIPKGWEVPTSGKKLRIGVVDLGMPEYLKVENDPQTNALRVSGCYIDVFDAVMAELPYPIPYEYIPFHKPDGSTILSYNNLAYQVFLKNCDAAIGDMAITKNRSMYVDFTLPFMEGGIRSLVPKTYEDPNAEGFFLKPLQKEMWLTAIALFILTGVALWILEHRINYAFRGTPSTQIGMICYFPFMSLVFAQRERIVSNFARLVLVVWVFVVLILSSSYTASLSARFTVQRLNQVDTYVNDLIKKEDNVGCREGSFVMDLLKEKGFKQSNIKTFMSPEDAEEALSKGSENGGISVFFAGMPFTKLFLSKYCDKYRVAEITFHTEGYAYAFQIGSPLVPDVSRAIIELTENGKIAEIERRWISDGRCYDQDGNGASSSIKLKSFRLLFGVTGGITATCVIAFFASYVHNNRDYIQRILNSSTTVWSKIRAICKHFDQRDPKSYRFSRAREAGENGSSYVTENHRWDVVVPFPSEEGNDINVTMSPSTEVEQRTRFGEA